MPIGGSGMNLGVSRDVVVIVVNRYNQGELLETYRNGYAAKVLSQIS